MNIAINHPVGELKAPMSSSQTFSLADYKGQKVILFFYPKDNTPGCTNENKDFRDYFESFQALNTVLFGVSRDTLRAHENFKKKLNLPYELISDQNEHLCRHFDVLKTKNRFGQTKRGIERSTFIIDEQGFLLNQWRQVKVPGHVENVYQYLLALHEK